VDFKRANGMEARWWASSTIDPATARLALLKYQDGELRYIIAPNGLKVGESS